MNLGELEIDSPVSNLLDHIRSHYSARNTRICLPFNPFPCVPKIAQMVSKPVDKSIPQFHIHRLQVSVEETNGTTEGWSNSLWRKLADLCQCGMIVNKLVFRIWQLEDIRKDRIHTNILRLPGSFAFWNLSDLVEWCSALEKDIWREVTVDVNQESGASDAIEVQKADSIADGVPHDSRCNRSRCRHCFVDLALEDGKVYLWEDSSSFERRWHCDGWKEVFCRGFELSQERFPWSSKNVELESGSDFVLESTDEKRNSLAIVSSHPSSPTSRLHLRS